MQTIHVEQLLCAVVWPQIREKTYYKSRPSVTKGCKTKLAEIHG